MLLVLQTKTQDQVKLYVSILCIEYIADANDVGPNFFSSEVNVV